MDTLSTVENSTNTGNRGKTVLYSIIGVAVGTLIGAGIVFYFFQDAVFFTTPAMSDTKGLSYPNPADQKVPDINLKSNILLPKKIVGEDYYLLINKIVDDLRVVGNNNVSTLIPLLDSIKQKSAARDFNGFFDLVTQAKNEITKNIALLETTRGDIANLKKINDSTVKDADVRNQTNVLLASSDAFVQEFLTYFALVNETLSGSFPTQSLLDKLTAQVTTLGNAGTSVQSELNTLLTIIKQKNDATTR
ncbi:MAG: hypothetical protein Q7T37_00600 [bacterium]|nr:hypothetical protein [bacterium]MDO8741915.1 hypothetical protein [bacterium]